jgi:protein TonB
MSSAPVAAADRYTTPGRDADTVDDARGIKYLKANYSYIVQLIHRHLTYPKTAWQMGWQGKVRISFFVSSDGDAEGIRIVESSGIAAVDRSALEAVKKASPFPKPPAEARISIPISYRLR